MKEDKSPQYVVERCQVCFRVPMQHIVHNIDGNHDNNSKSNLLVVCRSCHSCIHVCSWPKRQPYNNYWRNEEVFKRIKFYYSKLKKKNG